MNKISNAIQVINLGVIDYKKAHEMQLKINSEVYQKKTPATIIVCSHPSIVTCGKRMTALEINKLNWKGEIVRVERGGQATYHGTGQIIIYPIIPLMTCKLKIEDFLNILEKSIIETLNDLGIQASGNPNRGNGKFTGVWVKDKKIASIGIALKRWVSYHGLALNVLDDPRAFQGINPCGFNRTIMTSIEKIIESSKTINKEDIEKKLVAKLIILLNNKRTK